MKLLKGEGPDELIPHDGAFLGALFESLVTLSVRVFAQAVDADVYHLRDQEGRHEVDLIVEGDDEGILAIEVKLSGKVDDDDVKHLHWLRKRIGGRFRDAVVITTGQYAYRRPRRRRRRPVGAPRRVAARGSLRGQLTGYPLHAIAKAATA